MTKKQVEKKIGWKLPKGKLNNIELWKWKDKKYKVIVSTKEDHYYSEEYKSKPKALEDLNIIAGLL